MGNAVEAGMTAPLPNDRVRDDRRAGLAMEARMMDMDGRVVKNGCRPERQNHKKGIEF
jgi:hypothetical protein